jgi:hypothetical protein
MRFDCCEQLNDFFDDCLSANERTAFERHLESCPNCQSELLQMHEVEEAIRDAWTEIKLPSELKPNVSLGQDSRVTPPSRRERTIAWASLASLAAAIVATFFVTLRPAQNSDHEVASHIESESESDTDQPVAFYESGDQGTLLTPVVSTAEFTIVNAFPTSTSTSTNAESIQ